MRIWMLAIIAVLGLGAATADAQDTAKAQDPAVSTSYIIGPGDVLKIFVWQHEDLSVSVPVRPDGRISTPLIEDMQAAGKTPTQLARDMEGVLQEFVRSPTVNAVVEQFVGAFGERIRVVGQATNPHESQIDSTVRS